jgi:chorismate synthase
MLNKNMIEQYEHIKTRDKTRYSGRLAIPVILAAVIVLLLLQIHAHEVYICQLIRCIDSYPDVLVESCC